MASKRNFWACLLDSYGGKYGFHLLRCTHGTDTVSRNHNQETKSEQQPQLVISVQNLVLTLSLAFNIVILSIWLCTPQDRPTATPAAELGWTKAAALAAEKAATYNCSGHGNIFTDTVDSDDDNGVVCECFECFRGPSCADAVPDCDANADSGDPVLFESYWKQNAEASAILIPGWYRMSYSVITSEAYAILTPGLERQIRLLHKLVGNAATEGKYIVLGTGSMQLINCAISSLSLDNDDPASIVVATPYYSLYQRQTDMFQTSHYRWMGDANLYAQRYSSNNEPSIEFVTSPNNPDTMPHRAVLNGSKAYTIYDFAYYWPHFTAITETADHDVMLFSLSKVTGHAGSRIGWAFVKDATIYKKMLLYLLANTIGVSHDSQFRATKLLQTINEGYTKSGHVERPSMSLQPAEYAEKQLIFHFAYAKLKYRWKMMTKIFDGSNRFKIQHLEPQYCSFFKDISQPSPGYAWIRCEKEEDTDCAAVFHNAGIKGRNGSAFGADNRHIRLSLLKRDSYFENLVKHLMILVSTP